MAFQNDNEQSDYFTEKGIQKIFFKNQQYSFFNHLYSKVRKHQTTTNLRSKDKIYYIQILIKGEAGLLVLVILSSVLLVHYIGYK